MTFIKFIKDVWFLNYGYKSSNPLRDIITLVLLILTAFH